MDEEKPLKWYRKMYIRDNYKCVYCHRDGKESFYDWMTIENDHLIPASKGGSDGLDNMVTSCTVCNSFKGSYLPENYRSLSRDELLNDIREKIKESREESQVSYQKAMKEYEKYRDRV